MPSSLQYDVFLCHNSPEKDAALWLEQRLRNVGIRAFLDRRDLLAGTSLPAEIQAAFDASLKFAVLLGPSGIGPGWQSLEIHMAVQRATQDETFRIIVVLLPGAPLDELSSLLAPRLRIDFSSGIEDQAAFDRLVDAIRGSSSADRDPSSPSVSPPLYRSMAPPAMGFVPRSELASVLQALTEPGPVTSRPGLTTVALTTALRGAGGFGKTALAQAVCEDPVIRCRFPGGILWTTMGHDLTEADRLARVRDLLRGWMRKDPPSYETLEAAATMLRTVLSGQPVLVVADDVWLAADVEPFAGLAPPAALLLTTRNTRAVPPTARSVVVDALELPRAVELLGQGLAPLPPASTVERLTRRLGEWPILLRLVNAQLREEYRAGLRGEAAFRVVERALDEAGLTAFDREDELARNLAVRRTVEASLQRLPRQDRQRYGQLAVFAEDQRVPLSVLALLWETDPAEVHRLCRRLAEMSLLYVFDPVGRHVQLHDVMRAYLLREHREVIPSLHAALVDRHSDAHGKGGAPEDMELYFVSRLPYHLKESGRVSDLEQLLFSHAWLEVKTAKAGVNAAMADYQLLPGDEDAASVQQALRLSRAALTEDTGQLASQLHGRLAGSASAKIAGLLSEAATSQTRPWLRPLLATFQRPGGPFVFAFHAHAGEVRAIVQLDRERFATAATDGEIRVWNFASGELCMVIAGVGGPLRRLALVSPTCLLAAGDDGAARLWDLEQEQPIRTFAGHTSPVTALRLRHEQFVVGHEDGTLLLWSLSSDRPSRSFQGHDAKITDVGFLDAGTIVSISRDRTLRVWNTVSGRQLRMVTFQVFGGEAMEVTGSNELVVGIFAGEIQVWKPLSRQSRPRRSWPHRGVGLDALCLLRRDLGASTIGALSGIQLWNPTTGALGQELHVPGSGVTSLARFDRTHLLCGSQDGSVSAWAVDGLQQQESTAERVGVFALATVDASTVVSTADRRLRVWKVGEAQPVRELAGHSDTVSCVCTLSADRVASSSADSTIRIWNPHTGELLHTFQCGEKLGALAALTETVLVCAPSVASADNPPMQIWEVTLGVKVADIPSLPHMGALCAIDGRFLLIATYGGLVVHYDLSGAETPRNFALRGHEKGVACLATLDRNHVASGSLDETIRIWDLAKQETIKVLTGHTSHVVGLAALSPNLLASASADHSIRVWDVKTATALTSLQLDTGLSSITAMPDGKTLVAGDAAGHVHFLRLTGFDG